MEKSIHTENDNTGTASFKSTGKGGKYTWNNNDQKIPVDNEEEENGKGCFHPSSSQLKPQQEQQAEGGQNHESNVASSCSNKPENTEQGGVAAANTETTSWQSSLAYSDLASAAAAAAQQVLGQLTAAYGQQQQKPHPPQQTPQHAIAETTVTQQAAQQLSSVFLSYSGVSFSSNDLLLASYVAAMNKIVFGANLSSTQHQQYGIEQQLPHYPQQQGTIAAANAIAQFIQNQQQNNNVQSPRQEPKTEERAAKALIPPTDIAVTGPPMSKVLSLEQDSFELSPYQCLVRKQVEVFEHLPRNRSEGETTQGRNRPIVPGQVGIRCRHCGVAGRSSRARGAVLFPSTLVGLYQAAQNMANTHLVKTCKLIPEATRKELIRVRSREKGKKTCKSAYGGGRQYWANSLSVLGVVETDEHRLRFAERVNSNP